MNNALKEVNTLLGVGNYKWKDDKYESTLSERQYPSYHCKIVHLNNEWQWFISHGQNEYYQMVSKDRETAKREIESLIEKWYPNHVSLLNGG
jgi:hypothetical protein